MGEETFDLESQGGGGGMYFSDKEVRRGFIKKVYSIISVQVGFSFLTVISVLVVFQLLLTFGTVALFQKSYEIR